MRSFHASVRSSSGPLREEIARASRRIGASPGSMVAQRHWSFARVSRAGKKSRSNERRFAGPGTSNNRHKAALRDERLNGFNGLISTEKERPVAIVKRSEADERPGLRWRCHLQSTRRYSSRDTKVDLKEPGTACAPMSTRSLSTCSPMPSSVSFVFALDAGGPMTSNVDRRDGSSSRHCPKMEPLSSFSRVALLGHSPTENCPLRLVQQREFGSLTFLGGSVGDIRSDYGRVARTFQSFGNVNCQRSVAVCTVYVDRLRGLCGFGSQPLKHELVEARCGVAVDLIRGKFCPELTDNLERIARSKLVRAIGTRGHNFLGAQIIE